MTEALDHAVGDIIDELDRLELTENTIVIFMSDGGGVNRVEGSALAKYFRRGGKGALLEGGASRADDHRLAGRGQDGEPL